MFKDICQNSDNFSSKPYFLSNRWETKANYEIMLSGMECPSLAILSGVTKKKTPKNLDV